MKFTLEIRGNLDAMKTPADVARALRSQATMLDKWGTFDGTNVVIRDADGKNVGTWRYEEEG